MVGIVDSPTPTVPICSDSTRVMSSRSRNWWVSAHAATQPAVPPPAMTTLRIRLFSKSVSLFDWLYRAHRQRLSLPSRCARMRRAIVSSNGPRMLRAASGRCAPARSAGPNT